MFHYVVNSLESTACSAMHPTLDPERRHEVNDNINLTQKGNRDVQVATEIQETSVGRGLNMGIRSCI